MTDNPHGSALAFLAVLAYPDSTADRDSFIAAGRAWILRQLPEGPERDALAARLPVVRPRDIESRLDRGFKRIRTRRRWAAAEVQQEFLQGTPRRSRKLRVQELAAVSAKNTDASNAHRLIWRESLPVLHLAYVLQFGEALTEWRREDVQPTSAPDTRESIRESIRQTNLIRQRGPVRSVRINLSIDYSKPTGNMDPYSLIDRPGWIVAALTEAENVRQHLLAADVMSDQESIALLPK